VICLYRAQAYAARAAVDGRLFAGQRVVATHMQPRDFMDAVGDA